MGLTLLALIGSLLYAGIYIAVLALLVFGLGLPIYAGWKRPRQLALAGLAVLLITAPVFSVLYADELRQPSPLASSSSDPPYGNGGSVLQNAHVTPFTGAAGGTYTFTVEVVPQYLPMNTTVQWLTLYVTTCPGATGNASPNCPGPYPFYTFNHSFLVPPIADQNVTFAERLPGVNVWWWDVSAAQRDVKSQNLTYDFLSSGGGFAGVEGPVTGDFFGTVTLLIPSIYFNVLIFPGLVFYAALLVYVLLKNREARRKASRGPPPISGDRAPPDDPSRTAPTSQGSAAPTSTELSCPNCQAVVYPNETQCWKCGANLSKRPAEASKALPSNPP